MPQAQAFLKLKHRLSILFHLHVRSWFGWVYIGIKKMSLLFQNKSLSGSCRAKCTSLVLMAAPNRPTQHDVIACQQLRHAMMLMTSSIQSLNMNR